MDNKTLRRIFFFGLFVFALYLGFILNDLFKSHYARFIAEDKLLFQVSELTQKDKAYLNDMIIANKVHTATFALDRIVDFYERLFGVLIILTTISGIFGFLYVRNSHTKDIIEQIEISLEEKGEAYKLIKRFIGDKIQEHIESGNLGVEREMINKIEQRVDNLECWRESINDQVDVGTQRIK